MPETHPTPVVSKASARAAGLRYVSDSQPGISRVATDDGFRYVAPDGDVISYLDILQRLRKIAIPPAHTSVWICRDPAGHLQASGRDARGRNQYRYHPRWRTVRDEAKFDRMLVFAKSISIIQERVGRDLSLPGLPRPKVLATLVRLLEASLMRIGNEEYAKTNRSFGLSTLRGRHAKVSGSTITLDFRAKHGIARHIELRDRQLARIIVGLQDLPGQDLFQYLDDDHQPHGVASDDVNAYLRQISGEEITANDFRTYAASRMAAAELGKLDAAGSEAIAKRSINRVIEQVAKELGNNPLTCRKCYVHPAILTDYAQGRLGEEGSDSQHLLVILAL